jgi:hypothetical protein
MMCCSSPICLFLCNSRQKGAACHPACLSITPLAVQKELAIEVQRLRDEVARLMHDNGRLLALNAASRESEKQATEKLATTQRDLMGQLSAAHAAAERQSKEAQRVADEARAARDALSHKVFFAAHQLASFTPAAVIMICVHVSVLKWTGLNAKLYTHHAKLMLMQFVTTQMYRRKYNQRQNDCCMTMIA